MLVRDRADGTVRVEREQGVGALRLVGSVLDHGRVLALREEHFGVREERRPPSVLEPGDHPDAVDVRRDDGVDRLPREPGVREGGGDSLLMERGVGLRPQDLVRGLGRVDDDAPALGLHDPHRGADADLVALGPRRARPRLRGDLLGRQADDLRVDEHVRVRHPHQRGVAHREPQHVHADECCSLRSAMTSKLSSSGTVLLLHGCGRGPPGPSASGEGDEPGPDTRFHLRSPRPTRLPTTMITVALRDSGR